MSESCEGGRGEGIFRIRVINARAEIPIARDYKHSSLRELRLCELHFSIAQFFLFLRSVLLVPKDFSPPRLVRLVVDKHALPLSLVPQPPLFRVKRKLHPNSGRSVSSSSKNEGKETLT